MFNWVKCMEKNIPHQWLLLRWTKQLVQSVFWWKGRDIFIIYYFLLFPSADMHLEINEVILFVSLSQCTSLCCKQCQDTEITTKNEIFRWVYYSSSWAAPWSQTWAQQSRLSWLSLKTAGFAMAPIELK